MPDPKQSHKEPIVPEPAHEPPRRPLPEGGDRSVAGSDYGDYAPGHARDPLRADPSRGAEMERDALPPGADFSRPPDLLSPAPPAPPVPGPQPPEPPPRGRR